MSPAKVLLVEPTRIYQNMLSHLVSENGGEVTVVQSVAEALNSVRTHSFDLMFVPPICRIWSE